ncbi:MAG: ADP-ribosylglycohydrolase family protein [Archangium sp.]
MHDERLARARGALWGQAVGDALGTTVEFRDELGIATREPSAWPGELIGEGPFRLLPGQVTDDTELALAHARSLVRMRRQDLDDVATSYLRWRNSDPFDVGGATNQAFGGPATNAAGVLARASRNTQANGSLMRSSPLGIFGAGMKREELGALARADSQLSHPHEVCQWACAVFVTTIADAIVTGASGTVLHARALEFARGSPVEDTLHASLDGLPASDGDNQGWVLIALQHAFFHLARSTDFEAAMVQTVVKGGDTDTNAAIAGALLGATLGFDAIPRRWVTTVRDCLPQRPVEYRCGDLDELASALLGAR